MKYAIEIASNGNDSVIFNPLGIRLRGRLDSKNNATKKPLDFQRTMFGQVAIIPGIVIELDTEKKEGRTYDPLRETEAGRAIIDKINRLFERNQAITGGKKEAWATSTYKLRQDEVKEWAFHMSGLVEGGYAILVPGSPQLPSAEDVANTWPGKMRRDPIYKYREYHPEQYPEFVNEVTGKRAAATAQP
mgnify:CR=1 FL=1